MLDDTDEDVGTRIRHLVGWLKRRKELGRRRSELAANKAQQEAAQKVQEEAAKRAAEIKESLRKIKYEKTKKKKR